MRYNNCYVYLRNIPNYSWCGIRITNLELGAADRLTIQSGEKGDIVDIHSSNTQPGDYYVPTSSDPLNSTAARNVVNIHFHQPADIGSPAHSTLALSYQGKY